MPGGETTAAEGGFTDAPLRLIRDLVRISSTGFSGFFKKDCADLARRVSLLAHLLEEIRDSNKFQESGEMNSSSSYRACFSDLTMALQAAKRLVFAANSFDDSKFSSDGVTKKILFQFQCVTWKLEKGLTNLPYGDFDISEEVHEQVDLVRAQLRRATKRYGGPLNSTLLCRALSQPFDKEIDTFQPGNMLSGSLHVKNTGIIVDHEAGQKVEGLVEGNGSENHDTDGLLHEREGFRNSSTSCEISIVPKYSDGEMIRSSTLFDKQSRTNVLLRKDFRPKPKLTIIMI